MLFVTKPQLKTRIYPNDPVRLPKRKNIALRVLTALLIMSVALFGLRHTSKISFAGGLRAGCHKQHRNISTPRNTLPSYYKLPSGDHIPSVALGVWQAGKGEVGNAVKTALKAGYSRHIDGAWIYRNEEEVGQALRESGVPRDQVWLTSKLWNTFHEPQTIESTLDDSLAKLGTEYLDLYLIHWPVATMADGNPDLGLSENPYPTWKKLEELVDKGKIRNIGVSNFNIRRIQNLTANPLKIRPAVNQVEINFWFPQPDLIKWSQENGIIVEAYSPLGSSKRVGASLAVPEVKEIAAQLCMTPAQVIISWHVQRGTVVLPKSVTPSRVEENFQVRALPQDAFDKLEMAATSHKPERGMKPNKSWGVDVFG
ncbi:NADP-dependent oxidoreductase domain-containing protein [Infundibulicybe gibba]|nr:NADP-dependent oxidoreductase domain-containing protein [Infundibulicybe gibba]